MKSDERKLKTGDTGNREEQEGSGYRVFQYSDKQEKKLTYKKSMGNVDKAILLMDGYIQ